MQGGGGDQGDCTKTHCGPGWGTSCLTIVNTVRLVQKKVDSSAMKEDDGDSQCGSRCVSVFGYSSVTGTFDF